MTVRTRFSPSPTGRIHLGNARAALFSALYAASKRGVFILRIEDTDKTRSETQYTELLQDDLRWLGIEWQEGPGKEGAYGPYFQSQRQTIYDKYYRLLEEQGLMYPCFCSDQTLQLSRKMQLTRGQPPRYAGTCLQLSQDDIATKIAAGEKPAWRFRVPLNTTITFEDAVKGQQQFKSDDIGDFIIRRADGTPPFLFCNAIDDATMQVSHVLRGEDHLANTPRQLMLLEAMHLPLPSYGHLSLIVGDDGAPLSKRHGSFNLAQLQALGYLPQAVLNYLARLGHAHDQPKLLSFDQLTTYFNLEKLSRSPARFDENQLLFWQKTAVLALTEAQFWAWLGEDISKQIPESSRALFAGTIKDNITFPLEAATWATILFADELNFGGDSLQVIQNAGPQFFTEAFDAFVTHGIDLPKVLAQIKQNLSVSGKALFMPLRIALTGLTHGPEMLPLVQLLGLDNIKKRLQTAAELAKANVVGAD
ncbi:MAG: glutamate--tRNA ligase [Gammaproteobacteria bacterium]|nr:glutamate--tRNA ligase [Gammaproteobacteria bacterium]